MKTALDLTLNDSVYYFDKLHDLKSFKISSIEVTNERAIIVRSPNKLYNTEFNQDKITKACFYYFDVEYQQHFYTDELKAKESLLEYIKDDVQKANEELQKVIAKQNNLEVSIAKLKLKY